MTRARGFLRGFYAGWREPYVWKLPANVEDLITEKNVDSLLVAAQYGVTVGQRLRMFVNAF